MLWHFLSAKFAAFLPSAEVTKAGGKLSVTLGWLGVGLLLAMMLYSLRKRIRSFKQMGKLKHWLSFHIFCGVAGPLFILMHSNFNFRGLAGMAFLFMSIAVASGFIGRYLSIHLGSRLSRLEKTLHYFEAEWNTFNDETTSILQRLKFYRVSELAGERLFQYNMINLPHFIFNSLIMTKHCRQLKRQSSPSHEQLAIYVGHRKKLFYFSFLRKFFSYWHIFHLHFSVLFFLVALIHIGSSLFFAVEN